MLYGCCINLLPRGEDSAGLAYLEKLKAFGYDYAELPLREISALPPKKWAALKNALHRLSLPVRSCNDFMPGEFHITGTDPIPWSTAERYLHTALSRAAELGAPYAVFGSPWSRSCPEGFPMEKALEQVAAFLQKAGDLAQKHGITLVLEHNNRSETNVMNHYSDVVAMAQRVNHSHVRLLCDYYHLVYEGDTPAVLESRSDWLLHTHIARLQDRQYLTDPSQEPLIADYAAVLHRIGYRGGISIEARVQHLAHWQQAAPQCLQTLHSLFD